MTTSTDEAPRWTTIALAAIAFGGLLLRLAPLLRAGGPLDAPTDYDEAVYFSASALLFQGVLPYRDFVFVHPPGLALFLGLTSALARGIDPAHAFAAARVVATLVGAINIFLAGRVALRAAGPAAGIAAAALYAVYPDAVLAERGPYLEPVLNLACLGLANVWLNERRRPVWSGILCAAACAVKVLGGIWFLAALATARTKSEAMKFVAAAAVAGAAIVAPFFLASPRGFIDQTLRFHAIRPPDGVLTAAARLPEIANGGHLAVTILAVLGLVFIRRREARFFAVATLLTVAAFLAASSYWNAYNSHLAASECVLAGIGAAAIFRRVPLLAVVVALPSLWPSLRGAPARAPELLAVGKAIRETVPVGDCVFAFDPVWTLAGGRLPPRGDGAPVIVDSYGAMLLAAAKTGAKFPDAAHAFQHPAAQADMLKRLNACRFAVLGWRGGWQMSEESRAWFRSHFVCLMPNAGDLCLWERWGESHLGLAVTEPGQTIEFGDGWYAEEGTAQTPWRWMGPRGAVALPPLNGPARLELSLEVPVAHQTIEIAIDGRVVDRFEPKQPIETRRYDVAAGRALVITTTHTFRPPNDARDLGVRLNRIIWLAANRSAGAAATSSPR